MSIAWLGLGSNVFAETHIRAGILELEKDFEKIDKKIIKEILNEVSLNKDSFVHIKSALKKIYVSKLP